MKFLKRFRFSPVITVLSLALAFTCFYLGSWQFRRYEEKKVFFKTLAEATPESLPALDPGRTEWDSLLGRRFALTGTFDFDREMLLLNRTHNKRPGVKLITPLRLTGSDRYVLVDRGFIVKEESAPAERVRYHEPRGETRIMAAAYQSREGGFILSPPDHILDDPDQGWFRMNVAKMKSLLPYGDAVAPVYFEQIRTGEEYPVSLASEVLPPFRHLNYTMQWVSFGIFALIMGAFVQFRKPAGLPIQAGRESTGSALS